MGVPQVVSRADGRGLLVPPLVRRRGQGWGWTGFCASPGEALILFLRNHYLQNFVLHFYFFQVPNFPVMMLVRIRFVFLKLSHFTSHLNV